MIEPDTTVNVGVFLAMAAGTVSFLSPCVLPLVPGYLSVVTGVSAADLEEADWRTVLKPSLIFVASFSTIFILLGLSATGLGSTLAQNKLTLEKVSAGLIVAMGVFFIASLFVDRLNREFRIDGLMERAGQGGPIVVGAAFAIAWTPCVGPTLSAILGAAANQDSVFQGGYLLAFYSAGLAIPFLATALAFTKMTSAFDVVRRHYRVIMAAGGLILIAMGVLIWTGELNRLNSEAQQWLDRIGLDFLAGL